MEVSNGMNKEKELRNCNFVKTVLMIIVAFYHSALFFGEGQWFTGSPIHMSVPLSVLCEWMNSFHIHAFTLVSGYLFYFLKYEKGKYKRFCSFVVNKGKRLLIPFAVAATIWVVPIQCLFFDLSIGDIVQKYVLATSPSQLWFLFMLFDVFVICWLCSDFFDRHFLIGMVAVIALWGIGVVGGAVIPNVFMIWTACKYVSFFWIGFSIRKYGSYMLMKIPAIVWIIADIAIFAMTKFISEYDGAIFKLLNMGIGYALNIVGSVMAFVVLQKIADKIKWENKIFNFLIKRSMGVYLFHQQVIYFAIYLLNGIINPYLHTGINFAISMVVSLVITSILLRFKATRFLLGEK